MYDCHGDHFDNYWILCSALICDSFFLCSSLLRELWCSMCRKTLQEQCKLVLEENELLMEQLDVQQRKHHEQHKMHVQEGLSFIAVLINYIIMRFVVSLHHHHYSRFTALFQDHPVEPVSEESCFWTLWC